MSEEITENLHYKLRVRGLKSQCTTKDANGCIMRFWKWTAFDHSLLNLSCEYPSIMQVNKWRGREEEETGEKRRRAHCFCSPFLIFTIKHLNFY